MIRRIVVGIGMLKELSRSAVIRFLRTTASHMATVRPIRRVPGWWSGYASQSPSDAAEQVRRRLWDALAGQMVRIRWIDGIRLDLRMGNDIAWLLFIAGEIDPNELFFLAEFLRRGMNVIDVGANEGLFTLFCRTHVGREGNVVAIEPSKREARHLRRNLSINGVTNVDVIEVAIGDRMGKVMLNIAEDDHAGHNALGPPAAPWVNSIDAYEVDLTTLDVLAGQLDWPRIDLIKMDIEGSELGALRGAERLLLRDRPVLLLEAEEESLTLRGGGLDALLSWLRARDYEPFDFSAGGALAALGRRLPETVNLVCLPRSVAVGPS
jgi:FkbM family methyltransferase